MELKDARLDTILGAGFGTPFEAAVPQSNPPVSSRQRSRRPDLLSSRPRCRPCEGRGSTR